MKRGAEAAGLDSKRLDGQSEWIRHIGEGMFACRCVSVPSNRLERRNLAESTFSPAGSSWGLGVGGRLLARAPPSVASLSIVIVVLLRLPRNNRICISIVLSLFNH